MTEGSLQPVSLRAAAESRRAGRAVAWILAAFFAIVAAANGALIAYSLESFTGVTTENAYEKGLAYNQTLAQAKAEVGLGWQVGVDFSAPDRGHVRLAVTLHGRDGAALTGGVLTAHFIRPTSQGLDTDVALAETGAGRYEAQPMLPLPGVWDIVVTASHDGASYQTTRRIFVPE
jgi:nitrogen fixation protein FixH